MRLIRVRVDNLVSFFIVVLVVLNGLDYLTTVYAIDRGIGYELNPVARELMAKGKFDEYKLHTGVLLALIGVIVAGVERTGLPFSNMRLFALWSVLIAITGFVVAFYVVVVLNNLIVILMASL